MMQQTQQEQPAQPRRISLWLRVTLGLIFIAVLAVGFMGYLTPAMRVSWEAIASMCGF
ncbi:hypothetical protein [Zwartia panacis]|jgi:hypothetical protein|uniref:hypothetical protein n=1 Tax=Zwartia panacis TaxID=2683345 RepID=UPI0025B5C8B0|nr:hypothetical protein [Zwartia panacis]MDN4015421.1 hypothetical protein [Zwartia panacis]